MGKLLRRRRDELTLYARHLAWLHATPKPPAESKRAATTSEKTPTRLEQYRADKIEPPMPPCASPAIIERWIEIGMIQGGGMTPTALLWSEIAGFRDATDLPLSPWEARTIRAMSVAYIGESRLADDENRPAPWGAPISDREREAAERRLEMFFA